MKTISACLVLAALSCANSASAATGEVAAFIQRAGNANSDEARLECLKQLQALPTIDEPLRRDAAKLIAEIDAYIHTTNLSRFEKRFRKGIELDFGIAQDSPLVPLTWLYGGRMLTWYVLETGGLWADQMKRRELLDKARGCFEKTAQQFPKNRLVDLYLGRAVPAPKRYDVPASAPEWAVHQREAIERETDIIEWWIDNRMQPNGEYGGGWGDDCEMWRWWVPVLIGFDSQKISRAQAKFSSALLQQPHMRKGFTDHITDVEHSAEDSADAMTPMMHLEPENPVWRDRALRLADLMETLWTGRDERGFLQFKSTYFNVDRVDTKPERACDTVYHPRAVQPALLYWQRTGDARLARLFRAWMDAWVDATARSERGKPAGIIPSAIHWPDGRVGGLGPDWWDPRNHKEHTLYEFPSAMTMMMHTLLLTWHMTGDEKYLAPIRSMAAARLKYLRKELRGGEPGSEAWCASKINLYSVLAKYKYVSSDSSFDELLVREKKAGAQACSAVDRESLTHALRDTAAAFAVNFDGYTSEVRYTDRVLRFPQLFAKNGMFREPIPSVHSPNPMLLYSLVTGDPGDALYFPLNAVRWLTPPRDIAALVAEASKERFAAELFHFGKTKRAMSAEFFLLSPGQYEWEISSEFAGEKQTGRLTAKRPRTLLSFELPPQQLCKLIVRRATSR